MTIGEALRDLRRRLGLTQVELAQLLSRSRATVSAWEGGGVLPEHEARVIMVDRLAAEAPPEALAALAEALQVSAPKRASKRGALDAAALEALQSAIRVAADELDVPASAVRRTLAGVLPHLAHAGISVEDAVGALVPAPRKGAAKRA